MKKLLLSVLACALVLAMLSAAVLADGGKVSIAVSVDGNVTELTPGDEVTLRFRVSNPTGTAIGGVEFVVTVPDGFSLGEASFITDGNTKTFDGKTNTEKTYVYANPKGVSGDWDAFTVPLTATTSVTLGKAQKVSVSVTEINDTTVDPKPQSIPFNSSAEIAFDVIHTVHDYEGVEWTDTATCMEAGTKSRTCKTLGCGYEDKQPSEKKAHQWGEVQWTFDEDDMSKSTAKITCPGVGTNATEHTAEATTVTATIESTDATCTKEGTTKWKLVAQFGADGDNQKFEITHEVTAHALGHKWGTPSYSWNTEDPKAAKATLTVSCLNDVCEEYRTTPYTETVMAAADKTVKATCENDGHIDYTAKFTAIPNPPTDGFSDKKTVTLDALGHKWQDIASSSITWTGDPGEQKITGTVMATCEHGEDCDYEAGVELKFEYTYGENTATCTEKGGITATAKATVPGKTEPYTFTNTAETPALGHNFGDNKPVVDWPTEYPGEDPTFEDGTATLVCNRGCDESPVKCDGAVTVEHVGETEGNESKWSDLSYLGNGWRTYKATAVFPDGKGGKTEALSTEEMSYSLDQLDPPTPEITVSGSTAISDSEAAKTAVEEAALDAVKSALNTGYAAGISDDFVKTIEKAGAGNGEPGQEMTVKVELEVSSAIEDPNQLSGPNWAPALTLADIAAGKYYGIDIKLTVSGGKPGEVVTDEFAYITKVEDPIEFKFPVADAGDGLVLFVARYHDGQWAKINSTVKDGNLVFTSDKFSAFAAASSSSLAYADVSGLNSLVYNGKAQTPKPTVTINTKDGVVTLKEGEDYDLEYKNNTNVGTATVVIKAHAENAKGLTGSQEVTFQITKAPAKGGGSGSGTKGAPDTGNDTPLGLYAAVLAASTVALVATLLVLRRKRQK